MMTFGVSGACHCFTVQLHWQQCHQAVIKFAVIFRVVGLIYGQLTHSSLPICYI